jgi:hypothetical protein
MLLHTPDPPIYPIDTPQKKPLESQTNFVNATWTQVVVLLRNVSRNRAGADAAYLNPTEEAIRDALILHKEYLGSNLCTQKDALFKTLILDLIST